MFEKNPRLNIFLSKENQEIRKIPVPRKLYRGSRGDNPEITLPNPRVQYGDLAGKIAHRLTSIPGVIECAFKQYEISVRIGKAFDWKEVGPKVLGAIAKAVYPDIAAGRTLEISAQVNLGSGENPNYAKVLGGQTAEVGSAAGRLLLDIERMLEEGIENAENGKVEPATRKPESPRPAPLHAA